MYEVYLERRAERDLERVSSDDFHRIVSRIQALAGEPRPDGCRKITGSRADWRIRIGDYRVITKLMIRRELSE